MAKGDEGFGNVDFLDISGMIDVSETKEPKEKEKEEEVKLVSSENGVGVYSDGTLELNDEKEETPDKKVDKEEIKAPSEVEDSSPSSPYLAFARYNAEEGVFDTFTDEEWNQLVEEKGEDGALFELNKRTIEAETARQLDLYKKTLTDKDRLIFDSKINGLPLDEIGLITHNKQKFSAIKEEDLEDEKIQEEIVKHDLKLKGNTDEDVVDIIDSLKETDKLKTKAKNSIPSIIKHYDSKEKEIAKNKELEKQAELKQYQQEVDKTKLYVDSLEEVVPGLKLDKKAKEKLFNLMTTPAGEDENGQPINAIMVAERKNPVAFTAALHYYYDLGLFNIDEKGNFKPDFSKITGKIQTKVSKETRKIFEQNSVFQGGTKTGAPKEEKEIEDLYSGAFGRIDKAIQSR